MNLFLKTTAMFILMTKLKIKEEKLGNRNKCCGYDSVKLDFFQTYHS